MQLKRDRMVGDGAALDRGDTQEAYEDVEGQVVLQLLLLLLLLQQQLLQLTDVLAVDDRRLPESGEGVPGG